MNKEQQHGKTDIYQIKVNGFLDDKWSDWFDGFTISHHGKTETLLTGPVSDQGILHGVLAKIRDLGLQLLSVEIRSGD